MKTALVPSAVCLLVGLSLTTPNQAEAQFADLVRTINGKQYTLIDYSYNNALSNSAHNHSLLGRLFVPEDHDPNKSYELVMYLHGAGSPGNDNAKPVNTNINNLIVEAEERDFLVYIPQARYSYWSDQQLTIAQAAFAKAAHEYNVDPNRIYTTGISMGGAGVHTVMSDGYLNQGFGAYVPLSAANANMDLDEATGLPVWYYVGRQDSSFLGSTRGAVQKLTEAQGGTRPSWPGSGDPDFHFQYGSLRYTEFAVGGHNNTVWNNGAYVDEAMYDWMLSHTTTFGALGQNNTLGINFAGNEFATTEDGDGRTWNSLGKYGAPATEDSVLGFGYDGGGQKTTVSMAVTKAFQSAGNAVPAGITGVDDPVVAGEYWITQYDQSAELTFYGLAPGQKYDLGIFASTTDTNIGEGQYSVGGVQAILDAYNNTDQWALLEGLIADENGVLVLTVEAADGSHRAAINVIELTAVPEPATAFVMTALALAGLATRRRQKR